MEQNIQLAISIITFLVVIFFIIYDRFLKPDNDIKSEVSKMKESCKLKHEYLDENIVMIKENHLKHLEADVAQLKNDMTRVLTILEERFKK